MEQLLNQLPQDNPRHIGWRGIALLIVVVLGTVGFLLYAGGFSKIANIFGSKAGTESIFNLSGLDNLSNSQNAATWLVKDQPSGFDGTGAFSSFDNVPSFIVADSLDSAFIMPLVSSLDVDTFTSHTFTSAPINIGQTDVPVNTISIYAHLPETSTVIFGYRTSDDLAELNNSELHELNLEFSILPENSDISLATITLNREMKQYLAMTVDFHQFDSRNRPVVYGWVISYGQDTTPQVTSEDTTPTQNTKLTLTYSGGPAIPTSARVELIGSDLALNPMYGQDNVNFRLVDQYLIDALPLPAGAYAIRVTGPTIKEKVVPFIVEVNDTELSVHLEAFEAGSSSAGLVNADLNGDGKVNSLDAQLLFEQYSQTP